MSLESLPAVAGASRPAEPTAGAAHDGAPARDPASPDSPTQAQAPADPPLMHLLELQEADAQCQFLQVATPCPLLP